MSKTKIRAMIRTALWRANADRCFYCEEPVAYMDLEVDHLIAETTPDDRLHELVKALGLGGGFHVNGSRNLVPTHHNCNRRKSNVEFTESSLRFYLERWGARQDAVERELSRLSRQSSNDRLLSLLASRIDAGHLTQVEVTRFLECTVSETRELENEPSVVTFGLNVSDLIDNGGVPPEAPEDYASLCDWLEDHLRGSIRNMFPTLGIQTEASARNGETLSVRMAFWNLNLDHIATVELPPWEILEVRPFSEIYDASDLPKHNDTTMSPVPIPRPP